MGECGMTDQATVPAAGLPFDPDALRTLTDEVDVIVVACTAGYDNNERRPTEGPGWFSGNFGGGAQAFFTILRDRRAQDGFEVLETA
jgi:hypothetical protein